MSDGHFPQIVSATRDSNASSNPIYIQITDGTDVALVDGSGNLNVILAANSGTDIGDVDVTSVIPLTGATNLGKAVDAAGGGSDVGVAALALRDDALTTLTPVDGDYVRLRTTSTGALWVTLTAAGNTDVIQDDSAFTPGTSYVGASGYFADETAPDSVDEGDIGAARMTLDRKQLMVLVDATTDSQRLGIDASGHAQVDLAAVSVTAVPVSKDSSANAPLNPIYVQVVSTGVTTDEIHDYDTAAAVAGDATSNHDYAVTGATFLLKSIIMASSGGSKVEVQTGPSGSLTTDAVGFIPKEGGVIQLFFDPPIEVPVAATGTVRLIRTNRQGQAQDVYSTIIGNDVV